MSVTETEVGNKRIANNDVVNIIWLWRTGGTEIGIHRVSEETVRAVAEHTGHDVRVFKDFISVELSKGRDGSQVKLFANL